MGFVDQVQVVLGSQLGGIEFVYWLQLGIGQLVGKVVVDVLGVFVDLDYFLVCVVELEQVFVNCIIVFYVMLDFMGGEVVIVFVDEGVLEIVLVIGFGEMIQLVGSVGSLSGGNCYQVVK